MQSKRHSAPPSRSPGWIVAAGLFITAIALLASTAVYAGFAARSTAAEKGRSGTLDLILTPDVGAGFRSFVGMMAPGDTDNVFVDLKNTGTLASAAGMVLRVSGVPSNALVDGSVAGEGLTVSATRCSVAWRLATGACTGTTTPILATTRVSTVPANGVPLSNVPALAAARGKLVHLRVTVGLVATETSINSVPPVATVQDLTTALAFGFVEQQRTGIMTNK